MKQKVFDPDSGASANIHPHHSGSAAEGFYSKKQPKREWNRSLRSLFSSKTTTITSQGMKLIGLLLLDFGVVKEHMAGPVRQ